MRRYWINCFPLLALAACSDSSGPADSLTRAEALAIAAQVVASGETVVASVDGSAASPEPAAIAGVPTTFTHTLQSTHSCPSGGDVRFDLLVNGSIDAQAHSFEVDVEGSQTHASCAFPHNSLVITLDGNPDIGFTAHAAAINGQPSDPFTANVSGGVGWSTSDGRNGVCAITIAAVTDFVAKRRTVEGNVCDHTVTQTTTWS
jgi:hypothetical protein